MRSSRTGLEPQPHNSCQSLLYDTTLGMFHILMSFNVQSYACRLVLASVACSLTVENGALPDRPTALREYCAHKFYKRL